MYLYNKIFTTINIELLHKNPVAMSYLFHIII